MKLKKKENKGGDGSDKTSGNIGGSTLAVFFFIFMFGLALIPGGVVKADTTAASACDLQEPPYDCGSDYVLINFNLDKSTYAPGETIVTNVSFDYSYNSSIVIGGDFHVASEWDGEKQFAGSGGSFYFTAPTYSSNILVYVDYYSQACCGPTYGQGYLYLPFTVSAPAAPVTVTVTANDVPGQTTIDLGRSVDIKWTTQNATPSTHCTCVYGPNNTSCGQPSDGPALNYWVGNFTPTVTTTYTVNCQ